MDSRRRITSLFVILLGLSSALLSSDALPQGYHERHRRAQKCQNCPRDCSEKLADDGEMPMAYYPAPQPGRPAPPQYATAAVAPPSYPPHPTPAPYVVPQAKPQAQPYSAAAMQPYQRVASPARPYQQVAPVVQPYQPAQAQYMPDFNPQYNPYPYNEPADNYLDAYGHPGYDCPYGSFRCGRSLGANDDYVAYGKYNRRSLDANKPADVPLKPLPFADESSPPADYYRNYRPYARDYDRSDDDSEEESSRGGSGKERERLFVVYRADAFDDKPSDRELESVIRQAMDVARQQKNQENFARNGRKPNRYHYASPGKRHNNQERIEFKPLNEGNKAAGEAQRFNLSPGPLMNVGETYVTEEGDDALNPGLDQSKWTAVPSGINLELKSEVADEIDAAVSVVPKASKTGIMKVPKIIQKIADATVNKDKSKKEAIEIVRADDVEKKNEKMADVIEDMPTPSIVTEATNFEKPAEIAMTSVPTTDVTSQ